MTLLNLADEQVYNFNWNYHNIIYTSCQQLVCFDKGCDCIRSITSHGDYLVDTDSVEGIYWRYLEDIPLNVDCYAFVSMSAVAQTKAISNTISVNPFWYTNNLVY